jgi:hypothetical protein
VSGTIVTKLRFRQPRNRSSVPGMSKRFFFPPPRSEPILGLTRPPIQKVHKVKRPESEPDHSRLVLGLQMRGAMLRLHDVLLNYGQGQLYLLLFTVRPGLHQCFSCSVISVI